jgi:chromosomal replication initiation ATPase DnaA
MAGGDEAGGAPLQMRLPFPVQQRYDRAAFHPSASNQAALTLIDRWPEWPSHVAAIYAESGAGKTHLLRIWAARAGAALIDGATLTDEAVFAVPEPFTAAIDDADGAANRAEGARALFHALNRAQQEGGSVLLTGRAHPSFWLTALPDLRTRLSALPALAVEPPDDALLAAVLTKSFADRQLRAAPALIAYLVSRMERDLKSAERLVMALDRAALETGKPIGFDLAERLIAAQTHD